MKARAVITAIIPAVTPPAIAPALLPPPLSVPPVLVPRVPLEMIKYMIITHKYKLLFTNVITANIKPYYACIMMYVGFVTLHNCL